MRYLNENFEEVDKNTLDYTKGYLTRESNGDFVYHPFSVSQIAIREINFLKEELSKTDYQAIKYAEGQISEEDYAPMKAKRQGWRDEINQLEEVLRG